MSKYKRYYKNFKNTNPADDASASTPEENTPETTAETVGEAVDSFDPDDDVKADAEDIIEKLEEASENAANNLVNKVAELEAELEKEKKEYMFLMADFDNFRKRTLREKSEMIKNAGENVLKGLLPILDDFERGIEASEKSGDAESVVEGMKLIYQKFVKYLESNGVKPIESTGQAFDPDLHEAIAQIPAQTEDQKGKVIDTVQKGYMINDKVLRHAKVAVAQ